MMINRLADITQDNPIIDLVLQRSNPLMRYPDLYLIRFINIQYALAIEVSPDDDSVSASLATDLEQYGSLSIASKLTNAMNGKALFSINRIINMNGFCEAISVGVGLLDSPGEGEAEFRLEGGASMLIPLGINSFDMG